MKKCSVEGCDNPYYEKGHCQKHYHRIRVHGTPFIYSIYDPNEVVEIDENSLGIILKDKYGNYKGTSIIDKDCLHLVDKHKWSLSNTGYAVTNFKPEGKNHKTLVFMHRFLVQTDKRIDHINRDKLNNRISNLRVCKVKENNRNVSVRFNSISGVTGVTLCKKTKKWLAQINVNNKNTYLGFYRNKNDAIKARVEAEKRHWGEFAPQVDKYKHLLEGVAI